MQSNRVKQSTSSPVNWFTVLADFESFFLMEIGSIIRIETDKLDSY